MVLGASRSADDVVREFELDPTDRRELDAWLAETALEAWREGNLGGDIPSSWKAYHARALDELCRVGEVTDRDIRTLHQEARAAGDMAQAELCMLALHGVTSEVRDDARVRCEDAIRAARNMAEVTR